LLFLVAIPVLVVLLGAWTLVTGRSIGRGLTRGDSLRLQRAPAIYFRAVGAWVITIGLFAMVLLIGAQTGLPSWGRGPLEILEALLIVAFIFTTGWVYRLANRYNMFRWNKP